MRVMIVDSERQLLDHLLPNVMDFQTVRSVQLFTDGDSACQWAQKQLVDTAFLTIRPPELEGLALAARLQKINPNIRIVFLSEEKTYAYEAFEAEAVGYGLLPCSREKIRALLIRAMRVLPLSPRHVQVQTIPGFAVRVDGTALQIRRPKVRELFALLIDRGERGLTTGEGISLLWPERPGDTNAQALFRMTYKRLVDTLNEAGIGGILGSDGSRRYIHRHMVDCDLYSILEGDPDAAKKYAGEYLTEYSWAETRNGQLYRMLF
jgi:two-component SAPR family response regulator